ncbi:MAG: ribulose phosphate epimerase [Litoreibacter sp.]|nr:ribulose phosphate epimerase [Litoreibacter sp.]
MIERAHRCKGVSVGLFAAGFSALRAQAQEVASWGCDLLHFDIMDGVFVPQFTGGPGLVEAALGVGPLLDVHLMVQRPKDHVAAFVKAGADILTIHAESEDPKGATKAAREAAKSTGRQALVGVALMPDTPLSVLPDLDPDITLILSLDPRTSTPPDINRAGPRLAEARQMLPQSVFAFDGGVSDDTLPKIAQMRPDIIVSGSAIFNSDSPKHAFREAQELMLSTL